LARGEDDEWLEAETGSDAAARRPAVDLLRCLKQAKALVHAIVAARTTAAILMGRGHDRDPTDEGRLNLARVLDLISQLLAAPTSEHRFGHFLFVA